MSSHVLGTVEKLCDHIAIINRGRVVLQAETRALRSRLKDEASGGTHASLEDIFVEAISEEDQRESPRLSWL